MEREQPRTLLRAVPGHWFPRWLGYSRLSEIMTGSSTWPTFMAIVMLDHMSMGLEKRRRNAPNLPENAAFAVPSVDLVSHTGATEKTILQRAVPELLERGLLAHYQPGRGGKGAYQWPQFGVSHERLIEVFVAAASCLRIMHGGYADLGVQLIADEGLQIYGRTNPETGWPMQPGVIIAPWAKLLSGPKPETDRVDLDNLRRICRRHRPDTVSSQSCD